MTISWSKFRAPHRGNGIFIALVAARRGRRTRSARCEFTFHNSWSVVGVRVCLATTAVTVTQRQADAYKFFASRPALNPGVALQSPCVCDYNISRIPTICGKWCLYSSPTPRLLVLEPRALVVEHAG